MKPGATRAKQPYRSSGARRAPSRPASIVQAILARETNVHPAASGALPPAPPPDRYRNGPARRAIAARPKTPRPS